MNFKEYYDRQVPKDILEDKKPQLFCDMDGVLCDFEKAVFDIDGKTTVQDLDKKPEQTFWSYIVKGTHGGLKAFFAKMAWHPQGKQLWNHIKGLNPTILSAVKEPGKQDALDGKNEWLDREIGKVPRKFVERKDKQQFAKGNILIDDYDKNIKEWTEAGGKAILFRKAEDAIKQLNELMENIVVAPYVIVPDDTTMVNPKDK
jgi:5'(3')-deoxyribonucleotidase